MSVQLSPESRRVVGEGFDREWRRVYPDTAETEHHASEREQFLTLLQAYAQGLATMPESLELRDRKRKLKSAATALNKLAQALKDVDRDALAYVLNLAAKETGMEGADTVSPIGYFAAGHRMADRVEPVLSALYCATVHASTSLPSSDVKVEVEIARAIGHEITMRGFDFTVSAQGFAATCLIAVFEAAGLECKSPQHWLEQTRR